MNLFAESVVEEATLEWFETPGYDYRPGPGIVHDGVDRVDEVDTFCRATCRGER